MAAAPEARNNFPIVALCASADELNVAALLLDGLPRQTGMAFMLVLDASAVARKRAKAMLARYTPMTTMEGTDGLPLGEENLYICGPGTALRQTDTGLAFTISSDLPAPAPFDRLFDSMGDTTQHPVAVVILSGLTAVSEDNVASVKAAGARVIVAEGVDASWTRSALDQTDAAHPDAVLPIPQFRLRWRRSPRRQPESSPPRWTPSSTSCA